MQAALVGRRFDCSKLPCGAAEWRRVSMKRVQSIIDVIRHGGKLEITDISGADNNLECRGLQT